VIDGQIGGHDEGNDRKLDPNAIADTYLYIADQPKSTWTWELELRPSVEKF
jgi:NADP-dependent 3-hydroxy acid dehydrogenase YdfG